MPSFDVVSEVDLQEVRNAVDQANREARTRFDFEGVDAGFELTGMDILLKKRKRFPAEAGDGFRSPENG
jgi:uncharacterized protein YajQ (UPF0234 family)